jgi:hypothetical protein
VKRTILLGVAVGAAACVCLPFGGGGKPSTKQCKETWQKAPSGETVLDCQFKGGERLTNELDGKRYLNPVGTCWDYDVVVAQRCGCRKFVKASICCPKGSKKNCDWRIGNSVRVECKPYKQPTYGLSGEQEPADCRTARRESDCFARKDLQFAGVVVGPCMGGGLRFACSRGQAAMTDFLNQRCGPTPLQCGCTLVEECSDGQDLACYKKWAATQ